MELLNDEFYMQAALNLAEATTGQTGKNPVVGCVIVNKGRIVGFGSHLKRGEAHAEIHALEMAGKEALGATAYITLEPCDIYGQTPPCSLKLIESGISKIVIATLDPNPNISGQGAVRVQQAGIKVVTGVLEERARKLNEVFFKYIRHRLPFVCLKTALTLDGRIAIPNCDSRWITGPQARQAVHTLRHRYVGIMVGIGTVLADDPELTTRLSVPGLQPVRIIVDSHLSIPKEARAINGAAPAIVLTTSQAAKHKIVALRERGVEVIVCGKEDRVDLDMAMHKLGKRDIPSILLEGGGKLNAAMIQGRHVDKILLFYAPLITGSGSAPSAFAFSGGDKIGLSVQLRDHEIERHGEDWSISGYPIYHVGS